MRKVSLFLNTPPESWAKNLAGIDGLSLRILDCRPADEEGCMNEFFEVLCSNASVPEVTKRLQQAKDIKNVEYVVRPSIGKIFGSLQTTRCALCKNFTSSECFLASATYDISNEGVRWSFYVGEERLSQILKALEKQGVRCTIEENTTIHSLNELTSKQERLLGVAMNAGFFDSPRKAGIRTLAADLNVTPPTISVGLRRALKKVVSKYLGRK